MRVSSSSSHSFSISNNSPTWKTSNQHTPQLNNTFHSLNTFSITLLNHKTRAFRIHCINPDPLAPLEHNKCDDPPQPALAGGDGGGDVFGGGGDGGSGGGGEGGGEEDEEFGPLLNFEAVMKEAEARGITLPPDMAEAARITGIREMFLLRYLELLQVGFPKSFNFLVFQFNYFSSSLIVFSLNLFAFFCLLQGSAWPLSFLMKHCSMLRNRMLADPSFLFKVGTEVLIST